MGRAVIPVDLRNPGQVFACMGFLEAAEILCGPAMGGFEWDGEECFVLEAEGVGNPIETVFNFLAVAKVVRVTPLGWEDSPKKQKKKASKKKATEEDETDDVDEDVDQSESGESFPASKGERMELPIRLYGANGSVVQLNHWADGSDRNRFKLYAGNRSAAKIADDMLGHIRKLWSKQREHLLAQPLDTLCPMGGSFNFDPRGAWTAIDAGYSPDKHKKKDGNVIASPVVELMTAWGVENARPDEYETRQVRYAVWRQFLPPILARAALAGGFTAIINRHFRFSLGMSGKANKFVRFAQEESMP